jgi:hypothetical protein
MNAYSLAMTTLLSNQECASIFGYTLGTPSEMNPAEVLTKIMDGTLGKITSTTIRDVTKNGITYTVQATTNILGTVTDWNTGKTFSTAVITFNDAPNANLMNSVTSAAAALIHELGHAYDIIYGQGITQIKPDGSSTQQELQNSLDNAKLVKTKCGL